MKNDPSEPQVGMNDPRYSMWRKIYDVLLGSTPAPLREVLEPSIGTLSSRLVLALFPVFAGVECVTCDKLVDVKGNACSQWCRDDYEKRMDEVDV